MGAKTRNERCPFTGHIHLEAPTGTVLGAGNASLIQTRRRPRSPRTAIPAAECGWDRECEARPVDEAAGEGPRVHMLECSDSVLEAVGPRGLKASACL